MFRWPGWPRKVESVFFIGVVLFTCWRFVALLQLMESTSTGRVLTPIYDSSLISGDDHMLHGRATPTKQFYGIFLVEDPVAGKFTLIDWNRLSKIWSSKTSYADLIKSSKSAEILPSNKTRSNAGRIIFILHNHPKMASTTLRRACWENLRTTCGVVSPRRDPLGYSNADDLASLMEKCENTHHFCVMGWHFHQHNFPNVTSSNQQREITFIHLFPFRNFDDWAMSAMKQIYVGHEGAGCKEVAQRLERCHGWLELDFAKYSKLPLANMLGIMERRESRSPVHNFLLYDFSQVDIVLMRLCQLYDVPMPPYLDMQYKNTRQDGSCPYEILSKFHYCFDGELTNLTTSRA
ncbi:hypothetical protein ACHAWF_005807 [Thalassiosira exigua]